MMVEIEGKPPLEFPDGTDPSVIDAVVKRDFFPEQAPSVRFGAQLPGLVPDATIAPAPTAVSLPQDVHPDVPLIPTGGPAVEAPPVQAMPSSAFDIIQRMKGTAPAIVSAPTAMINRESEAAKFLPAVAEGVAATASGAALFIPSVVAGASRVGWGKVFGQEDAWQHGLKMGEEIMAQGYQPKTEAGQQAAAIATMPFEAYNAVIDKAIPDSWSPEAKAAAKMASWGAILLGPPALRMGKEALVSKLGEMTHVDLGFDPKVIPELKSIENAKAYQQTRTPEQNPGLLLPAPETVRPGGINTGGPIKPEISPSQPVTEQALNIRARETQPVSVPETVQGARVVTPGAVIPPAVESTQPLPEPVTLDRPSPQPSPARVEGENLAPHPEKIEPITSVPVKESGVIEPASKPAAVVGPEQPVAAGPSFADRRDYKPFEVAEPDKDLLTFVSQSIEAGQPGERGPIDYDTGKPKWFTKSTYPEWFSGLSRKDYLPLIDKAKAGENLTAIQRVNLTDLMDSARGDYSRSIQSAEQDIPTLELGPGDTVVKRSDATGEMDTFKVMSNDGIKVKLKDGTTEEHPVNFGETIPAVEVRKAVGEIPHNVGEPTAGGQTAITPKTINPKGEPNQAVKGIKAAYDIIQEKKRSKMEQKGLDLGLNKGTDLRAPERENKPVSMDELPLGQATNAAVDRSAQGGLDLSSRDIGPEDLKRIASESPETVVIYKSRITRARHYVTARDAEQMVPPDLRPVQHLHSFGSTFLRPIGKVFGINDNGQAKWVEHVFDNIGEHIRPEIKDQFRKFFRTHAFYVEEHPEAEPLFDRELTRAENRHRDARFVFAPDPEHEYAGVEPLLNLSAAKKLGKLKFGKDELGELSAILVQGDKDKLRYSPKQLKDKFKASDKVAEAYNAARDLVERMQAVEVERSKEIALVPYEGDPALHDKLFRVLNDLVEIPDAKERERYMSRIFHEQASVLDAEAQRALKRIQDNVTAILDRIGVFENNPGYIPRTRQEGAYHVRAIEHVLTPDEAKKVLGAMMYGRAAQFSGEYSEAKLKEKFGITGKVAKAYEAAMEKAHEDAILSRRGANDAEVRKAVAKIVDSVATREVWMESAETFFKAKRLMAKAQAKPAEYLKDNYSPTGKYEYTVVENKKLPEEIYMDIGNPAAREAFIERAVRAAEAKGTISVQDAESISDMILRAGQEEALKRGGGKSRIQRQENLVEGYKADQMDKVLIDHVTGQVGYLNKALYSIRALRDIEGINQPGVLKWAHVFYKNSLKNSTPLDQTIAKAKGFAVFYRLGGVVKTMVQNGFQQVLNARSEMVRYTNDDLLLRAKADIFTGKLSEFDRRVIHDGLESGQTDAQYMRDITGMADRGPARGLGKLGEISMKGFGAVETELNRKPALVAAMRLFTGAKDAKGHYYGTDLSSKPYHLNYEEAMKKAQKFIRATHYEITKSNEPEIVQTIGGVARGMYTFQSFTANAMNWIFNRARHGEVRVLGRFLLATWALGGVLALPFSDEIDAWLTKEFGLPMKHRIRELLKAAMEQTGLGDQPTMEEIIMNGIPSGLGVNMGKSVQLNTPLPIQVMMDTDHTMEQKASGAIGGLVVSAGRAAEAAGRGDWWRVGENITPNVVGNIIRAARLYQEGATTSKGRPIMDDQGRQIKATGLEAGERAAGFMPSRLARYQEANNTERNMRDYWEGRRQDLLDKFRISFDDKEANKKVQYEIMSFNDTLMKDHEANLLVSPIMPQSLKNAVALPHGKKAMKEMMFMQEMTK